MEVLLELVEQILVEPKSVVGTLVLKLSTNEVVMLDERSFLQKI